MVTDEQYRTLSRQFMSSFIAIHQKFFRKAVMPIPLNQFLILQVLSNDGPTTMHDLSAILLLSKQQMTPLIEKLVRLDMISREPMPNDRRFTVVSLTPHGQSIVDAFNEQLRQRVESGLRTLPDEDIKQLSVSGVQFADCIDRMKPNLGIGEKNK